MKGIINLVCKDVTIFPDKNGEVLANFYYSEDSLDKIKSITACITSQTKEIFGESTLTPELLKRLEQKLSLSLEFSPVLLTFVAKENNLYLQESLKYIYEKNYISFKQHDFQDTIEVKVTEVFSFKARTYLRCFVLNNNSETFELDITDDVNNLYFNDKAKAKFKQALRKESINKRVFLDNLFIHLEGKIIKVKYTAEGYELSTTLEMLISL